MSEGSAKTRARKLCGAKNKSGGTCKRGAGAGTDHPGHGRCSLHTGKTPTGNKVAALEAGKEAAREMMLLAGEGAHIEPGEALLACVQQAWAEVQFYNLQISRLELDAATTRPTREKTASLGERIGGYEIEDLKLEERMNLWVQEKQRALERLAKFSKMALDAGVAQQQVDIAQRLGGQLGSILQRVIQRLDLSAKQLRLVPGIVRSELAELTTGAT